MIPTYVQEKRHFGRILLVALALLVPMILAGCTETPEINPYMSYQAQLLDASGNPKADGSYSVAFRLWNDANAISNANLVYAITQTVSVKNGVFSTVWTGLPTHLMGQDLFVEMRVKPAVGGSYETLTPRQRLTGAPFAFSLIPGSVIKGVVNRGEPVTSTLTILNRGSGDGLQVGAVFGSANTGGSAIVAENYANPTATLILNNHDSNGDLIRGYNEADLEFRVHGNGNVTADGSFTGGGADYADMMMTVPVAGYTFSAGDVLILSSQMPGRVTLSNQPNSTLVAGVYSTKPVLIGRLSTEDVNARAYVPVALVGMVPVKVTTENGAIKAGDLLTTSSLRGHAMKASPLKVNGVEFYAPGTILGKAMGNLDSGKGVVLVLLSLQ